MSDFNKITMIGNLTRDPEQRFTTTGKNVVSFSIANNRVTGTGDEKKEKAVFMPCVAFGNVGDAVARFCHKGDKVLVDGLLDQDHWDDKETGQKRSAYKVICNQVHFLKTKNGERGDGSEAAPQSSRPIAKPGSSATAPAAHGGHGNESEDDVPF